MLLAKLGQGTDPQTGSGAIVYKLTKHASSLVQMLEEDMQRRSNIIVSDVQTSQLPKDPVRETYLERLMLVVMRDKTPGKSAIYAEAGTGKSVATLNWPTQPQIPSWCCKMI